MDKFEQGLAKVLRKTLGLKRIDRGAIIEILKYLDSEGIRRLTKRRLPDYQSRFTDTYYAQLVKKAGIEGVERIIEE